MAISKITSDAIDATDFNLDSNTLTIDATNNRVGIGTNSPSTSLDVVRAGVQPLRVESTNGTEVAINMVNTGGNVQLEAHSGNFNIDADKVGIGKTTPAFTLDIVTVSDNGVARFESGDANAYITILDSNSSSAGNRIGCVTDDIYFSTTNTERMRIDSSGNVGIGTSPSVKLDIDNGSLKVNRGNSSGDIAVFRGLNAEKVKIDTDGIKFNGDTAAANALDDYEEGSWSPTVEGSGGNPTVTYTSLRNGNYVKIGKLVFITFIVDVASISGGSGTTVIGALPYTINSAFSSYGNQSLMLDDLDGDFRQVSLQPNPNTTTISLIKNGGNTASHAGIVPNTLNAGTAIRGVLTYRAA
jgi:hypothetical protein